MASAPKPQEASHPGLSFSPATPITEKDRARAELIAERLVKHVPPKAMIAALLKYAPVARARRMPKPK